MNFDPKILIALDKEKLRQKHTIELIASENFVSPEIMALTGSEFTNKYAEGLPGYRYYNGCDHVDVIENLANEYLQQLFNCSYSNVQPHSGANANLAVFKAFLNPKDTVLGMDLSSGGHLSHGSKANISGQWFNSISYGLNEHGLINYSQVYELAVKHKPKLIIAGASAYSQVIDWVRFKDIASETNSLLLADISHYSGLIAGEMYPNPFPYADIVTSATHKTLRGPRGGVILWNNPEYSKKLNSAVFPGTQGGPLMHVIAAKAQCFYEALQPTFYDYAKQIILNANLMANTFMENGVDVVSGGTKCHMFTLDLSNQKYSGKEYANILENHHITVNKNSIPNDPRSFTETSGVRIGVAAETTRGRKEEFFEELAFEMIQLLKK